MVEFDASEFLEESLYGLTFKNFNFDYSLASKLGSKSNFLELYNVYQISTGARRVFWSTTKPYLIYLGIVSEPAPDGR